MTIPSTFNLGGHTYTVRRMDKTLDRGAKGECFNDQLTVFVRDDTPQSDQQETFWHEVMEAINHRHDLQLSHGVLTTIAVGIHQVDVTRSGGVDGTSRRKRTT